MDDSEPNPWPTVLGVGVLLMLLVSLALVAAGGWSWFAQFLAGSADSWVQAILAGVVIVVTAWIARATERSNQRKEEHQRQRNFRAAQAFLPDALASLGVYLAACAKLLNGAFYNPQEERQNWIVPTLEVGMRETLRESIRHATPEVGDHLAMILRNLQVNHSRITQLRDDRSLVMDRTMLISYMYGLGEIQAMVDRMYPFARDEQQCFHPTLVEYSEFRSAFRSLDIDEDEIRSELIGTLEEFTKRRVVRLNRKFQFLGPANRDIPEKS